MPMQKSVGDKVQERFKDTPLRKKGNLPDPDELVLLSVNFAANHKQLLKEFFKNHYGMDFSNGVRMVLYQYMRENGISQED